MIIMCVSTRYLCRIACAHLLLIIVAGRASMRSHVDLRVHDGICACTREDRAEPLPFSSVTGYPM